MERTNTLEEFKVSMALEGISKILEDEKEYYWLITDHGTDCTKCTKDHGHAYSMFVTLSDFIRHFDASIRLGSSTSEELIEEALKFFTKHNISY